MRRACSPGYAVPQSPVERPPFVAADVAVPTGVGRGCDPSYADDISIETGPPDLDYGEVPYTDIRVLPPDPHGFDGKDNDGWGCES